MTKIVTTITSPNSTYHSIRPISSTSSHTLETTKKIISHSFVCNTGKLTMVVVFPNSFANQLILLIEVAASSASGSHAQHQWPRNNLPCVRALSGAVLCSTSLLKHGFIPEPGITDVSTQSGLIQTIMKSQNESNNKIRSSLFLNSTNCGGR